MNRGQITNRRPYQREALERVIRGFDRAHDGRGPFQRQLGVLATGGGKCLGKGTPVLMFDGTIRAVETIRKGELLMGPGSKPVRVLSTCKGRELLYQVTPTKGDPYVVNASHILSLVRTATMAKPKYPSQQGGKIVNINVEEFAQASKTFRHKHKGWRAAVDFPDSGKTMPLPPYLLGVWLGDGNSNCSSFGVTNIDPEVIAYLKGYADSIGHEVVKRQEPDKSPVWFVVKESGKKHGRGHKVNVPTNALRGFDLHQNKHIPHLYKTASRKARLELLAGLIDTDGSRHRTGFDFISKIRHLAEDVAFVARSLGFAAYVSPCKKTCKNNGKVGDYFRVGISGECSEVPVLIPRKKPPIRRQKKDVQVTGISVAPIGEGEYFGFEIDGTHLFMLGDFTVTHNTVIFADVAAHYHGLGENILVLADQRELVNQAAEKLLDFGGLFAEIEQGGRHALPGARVVVASMQSMVTKLDEPWYHPGRFGLVIADEADRCFPYRTLVTTIEGPMQIGDIVEGRKRVEVASCDLSTGKLVWRHVTGHWKNAQKPLYRIQHEYGEIICTGNHKVWTEDGYVWAENLVAGNHLRVLPAALQANAGVLEVATDVQQEVRRSLHACEQGNASASPRQLCEGNGDEHLRDLPCSVRDEAGSAASVLHSPLRGEGENGEARGLDRFHGEGAAGQCRCTPGQEEWQQGVLVAHDHGQPDDASATPGNHASQAEGADLPRAGWQRQDDTPARSHRTGSGLADGVRYPDCAGGRAVPQPTPELQGGLGLPGEAAGHRGGRSVAQLAEVEVSGPPQDGDFVRSRVERITLLQPGSGHEPDGGAGDDSHLYDIEVEKTHNYFADAVLVSNSMAPQWQKVLGHFAPHAKIFGLTATPERADKKSVLDFYQDIAFERNLYDLIGDGYLSPVTIRQEPLKIDLTQVASSTNENGESDYNKTQLGALIEPAFDDICQLLIKHARDKGRRRVLAFLPLVETSKRFVEACFRNGINARHVDGAMPNRDDIVAAHKRGEFWLLSNAMMLCLDTETEILTAEGFKGVDALRQEDLVANWWLDGSVTFQSPEKLVRRPAAASEKFVAIGSRMNNLRVTDNHEMVVGCGAGSASWKKIRARNLRAGHKLPTCGQAAPATPVSTFPRADPKKTARLISAQAYNLRKLNNLNWDESFLEAARRVQYKQSLTPKMAKELSIDECRLIGFWIADGTFSKGGNGGASVSLSQSNTYHHVIEWVDALIIRLKLDVRRNVTPAQGNANESIVWHLSKGCNGGKQTRLGGVVRVVHFLNKQGHAEFWQLSEQQFAGLLDGYWRGDGYHGQVKADTDMPSSVCFSDTKKPWLEMLQAIGCVRGWRADLHFRPSKNANHKDQWHLRMVKNAARYLSGKTRISLQAPLINEEVWCVTTQSGNIITRRRGKVTVMGNSRGYDDPAIDTILPLRITKSASLYRQMIGRGTRIFCPHRCAETCQHEERKRDVLVFDFLFAHGRLGPQRPANLIASTPEEAEAINKVLEKNAYGDKPLDLQFASDQAAREREIALLKQLEKAGKRKSRTFDAQAFAIRLKQRELIDYEPMAQWEREQPSDKQKALLTKWGFSISSVKSKGHATKLLNVLFERRNKGMASFGQVKFLTSIGDPMPESRTRKQADEILGRFQLYKQGKLEHAEVFPSAARPAQEPHNPAIDREEATQAAAPESAGGGYDSDDMEDDHLAAWGQLEDAAQADSEADDATPDVPATPERVQEAMAAIRERLEQAVLF
jgi:superfamily II DNA or RNA helicase/intein/homing endonuclease